MKPNITGLFLVLAGIVLVHSVVAQDARQDPPAFKDPQALSRLIAQESEPHLVIDVRTAAEYTSGHIPTALNIPYDVIAQKMPETDKDTLVVVYCRSGARAGVAEETLRNLGYTRVVNFGGVSRWRGKLVTGSDPQ